VDKPTDGWTYKWTNKTNSPTDIATFRHKDRCADHQMERDREFREKYEHKDRELSRIYVLEVLFGKTNRGCKQSQRHRLFRHQTSIYLP